MENTVDKVIITVVGKDTVGIIAKVCTYISDCQKDLDAVGEQIGVSIKCQKEEIFEKMHRI